MQTDNYGSRCLEKFGTRRVELNLTDRSAGIQSYITGEYLDPPVGVLKIGYILVSGVWKNISNAYTIVSGSWKSITEVNVAVSEQWKKSL